MVDSSSLEGKRRQRRAKTDRLDGPTWRTRLLRHRAGEQKVWSVVRVPRVADDERRQLHRELLPAQRARTRVTKRMQGRLASQGWRIARQGAGAPLPPALRPEFAVAKYDHESYAAWEPMIDSMRCGH